MANGPDGKRFVWSPTLDGALALAMAYRAGDVTMGRAIMKLLGGVA